MTVKFEDIPVETGGHAVQFYERDSELAETVGRRYLAPGLAGGGVAIVIATQAHRQMFEAELREAGLDPDDARREGTLIMLDASETLARFMPRGQIDRDDFYRVIGSTVRAATETGRSVQAYGEMVAVLWDLGDVLAAIRLEQLWNELGEELPFSLLCGYHSAAVSGPEHAEALHEVCHLHSAVLRPPAPAEPPLEASARFHPSPDAPRTARRFAIEALRGWGYRPELLDDAELVVSELATNATVHARSAFSVTVRSEEEQVRLSVSDASAVAPFVREAGPTAMFGRGMALTAGLASAWGVEPRPDGKTVWAELRR